MDNSIVSRDHIRAKGRAAFWAGKGRNDHDMNPGAAAIRDWQDGWRRAFAEWASTWEAAA